IYMLDSHGCAGDTYHAELYPDQISWFKSVSAAIDAAYGEKVPAFACYHIPSLDFQTAYVEKYGYEANISSFNLDSTGIDGDYGQKNESLNIIGLSYASDLKAANVDGVFVGHDHLNNYSILYDGIRYTYGTKTGTYDMYNASVLGGTLIRLTADGKFKVSPRYLDKQETENRKSSSLTITFMSDIHFDEKDYGDFHCTQAEAKLKQIVSETQGSRFYVNLGDTVNSLDGKLNNMYDAVSVMKELGLNVYNSEGTGYTEDNRMMYNLCGNHEAAYYYKSELKDYIPYVEDVGTVGVFKYEDLMFVMVDALFDSNGADDPDTVFYTKFFTIPDVVINWLTAEVASQMDETVKGIVLLNHVALQDIDDSKYDLLNELKGYGLPMTVFDGHTHAEAYHELTDDMTGKVYCEEYTLPAVTLNDGYPYYNVTFKDGKVLYVDKHTTQTISVN
ncbi:MAG: metallophosphoesterase, partial [Clostridia bacterium]|nr:metallophosphoesterase [Clostridia bacterium]